jgi:N-acetylmuramoyl-L-alanine amidase
MVKQTLAFLVAVLAAGHAYGAPPVRTMYDRALARETAVRPALASEHASTATLTDARGVVAAYEAVVRRYPASSYSDNALWQAGRLALDAFARFGQARDRETGVRLLRQLTVMYPSSRLARQVPDQIARLDATPDAPPPVSAAPVARGTTGSIATIRAIRRTVLPDAVRITIELDDEVPFHDERIADPARVFVDLPSTRPASPLAEETLRFTGDADIVRQVRVGRHPNHLTRVVLDATGVSSYSVYPLYAPYRLVIDCVRATAAAPAPLQGRQFPADWGRRLPARSAHAAAAIRAARTDLSAGPPAVMPSAAPPLPSTTQTAAVVPPVVPPARTLAGGFSIARQLGLGVSRIVIDPGHGGHDPGARGKGVTEAELVLDVALRLEKLLAAVPGVDVILTRRTDDFIALQERTAIANREGADLFLSIHANASPSAQARGIETYFLNFANTLSAAGVAARENAASGQAMGALPDFVKAIALNNKLDESREFATEVQRQMIEKLRGQNKTVRNLGVKQAPFVVLIGAAMPSVLAEISFVTNPQEAKLLKSNAYRQKIADALFAALRRYQTSLKGISTAAPQ